MRCCRKAFGTNGVDDAGKKVYQTSYCLCNRWTISSSSLRLVSSVEAAYVRSVPCQQLTSGQFCSNSLRQVSSVQAAYVRLVPYKQLTPGQFCASSLRQVSSVQAAYARSVLFKQLTSGQFRASSLRPAFICKSRAKPLGACVDRVYTRIYIEQSELRNSLCH